MSIKVENITKKYGSQLALNNVSFEILPGEIAGFIGPNGAGKSTLMKIICGLLPPDSGNIYINDKSILEDSLEVRKDLGYLAEHNPLYHDMYIKEYLKYTSGLYKLGTIATKRIEEIIELTGLRSEIKKKIGQLSKGFRQRVGLAQALLHNPGILILDEPTTGLDPNQIVEIRNLIVTVSSEKTILLSTHIMQEVEAICDKVIIINKGEIVANDIPSNLKTSNNIKAQSIIVEFDKKIDAELFRNITGIDLTKKVNDFTWIIEHVNTFDIRPELFNLAVKNNLTVLSMQKVDKRLEDVFRELTDK